MRGEMICEICKEKTDSIPIYLPIPNGKGARDSQACVECAEKSGVYCLIHEVPYTTLENGLKRCSLCVIALADKNRARARILVGIVEDAAKAEFDILKSDVCYGFMSEERWNSEIYSFLCSMAVAMKIELDDLVQLIVSKGSLEILKTAE